MDGKSGDDGAGTPGEVSERSRKEEWSGYG